MIHPGPDAQLGGRLLVSAPGLDDPNFARTVVLVLDHDEDGAVGVVLNRSSDVPVGEILPGWRAYLAGSSRVHHGGPVGTDTALALAAVADGTEPVGFRPLYGGVGLLDLDVPPELVSGVLDDVRVFAGYAGWAPGQLESEVAADAWFVVDAEPGDPFTTAPEVLWRDVLRRQPGPLAWVSTAPGDPTMN